jgi:hypothetical protein
MDATRVRGRHDEGLSMQQKAALEARAQKAPNRGSGSTPNFCCRPSWPFVVLHHAAVTCRVHDEHCARHAVIDITRATAHLCDNEHCLLYFRFISS